MAIGTYSELGTAVTSFSKRTDLATSIDDFIALTEEAIYNGVGNVPPLRVTGMEETVSSGLPTLPSDFLEAIRLTVSDGSSTSPVEYLSPATFSQQSPDGSFSQFYTIIDGELVTAPTISGTYTLNYYKRLSALSSTATTNWILTNGPGIYLFGCLMFLYKMTRDRDGEQSAMRDYAAAVSALQNRDRRAKQRGSNLQVRAQ